jgi:hypothetical protein
VAEADAGTAVDERGEPVYPPHSIVRKVSSTGNVGYLAGRSRSASGGPGLGSSHPRERTGPIFYGEELVRALAVDPDSYHHPLGRRVTKVNAVR